MDTAAPLEPTRRATEPSTDAAPRPFACAAAVARGERWGRAVALAVGAHAGALALVLVAARVPAAAAAPETPELVFLAARAGPPPGPPALARPAPTPPQPRPARTRPAPRRVPPPVVPTPLSPETPPGPEPEPAVAEASADAAERATGGSVAGAATESGGGSPTGGLGVAGGDALTLAQVSRAPLTQVKVAARYPREARRERLEGRVVLRLIIGVDGRVEPGSVRVVGSVPGLDDAAIEAVQQWRFSPALGASGRPVRVIVDLPISFSLR